MKLLFTLLIAAALVAVGAVGFAYSGLFDVSASTSHGGLVNWLLSATSHASIERRAADILVPDLSDDALVRAGVNDFSAMCAACHGAPGQAPEAVGKGLNPPAPDLADSAARMNPSELFWVTKNGIKMTGMPSWGVTHDDVALWPVVAFMTRLPDLDAARYQALLAEAQGIGHHGGGDAPDSHDHDEGSSEAVLPSVTHDHRDMAPDSPMRQGTPSETEHDHSTHSHDEPTAAPAELPHDDDHDHTR